MRKHSIKLISLTAIILNVMLYGFSTQVVAQQEATKSDKKTDYVSLGKPMVLNLSSKRSRLTFLQLSADMLVKSEKAKEIAENFLPVFRHILILKLSEQDAQDIRTPEKREVLRAQISTEMIKAISEMSDASDIEEVLFSQFLVQ